MIEPLYQIEVNCLHCGQKFRTSKVRSSFKKRVSTDSDFYNQYDGINPEYYVVRVCPHCGFAGTENFGPTLSEQHRHQFTQRIGNQWNHRDFGGERTWEEAVDAFKLALVCAQIKQEKNRMIASLLHHLAWLYRDRSMHEPERRFLQFALDAYTRVYENEDTGSARLMYLIGDLHRRLGQFHDAVRWFGRVIHDERIADAAMIRASREQWAATREEMLNRQLELPDAMKQESDSL